MRPPLTYLDLTYAELNLVIGTEAIKLKVRTIGIWIQKFHQLSLVNM